MKITNSEEYTKTFLMQLLAYELFNAELTVACDNEKWNEVIDLAQKHSVEPIIYLSAKRLSSVPDKVLGTLRSSTISSALRNEKILAVQEELIRLFEKLDIPCAILKGSSVSTYYPYSDIRILGDIDILVDESNLNNACNILTDVGYYHSSGHSFHECYEGNGIHVELHQAVSDFPENDKGRYTAAFMKDALNYTIVERLGDYRYPVLDASHQITALLSHMERHMTNTGIGLRQLCDWAVTVEHYRNVIDDGVLNILTQCGLLRFAEALTKACTIYLSLPKFKWAEEVSDVMADKMISEIITSGNIPNIDTDRGLSSVFVSQAETDNKKTTLLGQYISNINKRARTEYPHIGACPISNPLFWLFYPARWWIRSLLGEREKINVYKTLSIAYKRKKLYDELRIFQ